MFFKIAIFIFMAVVALPGFAATKPNTFRVQRSITIHASQREVFPLINDLHAWEAWSDDNEGGETVQKIYSGPASGTGAMAEWNGSGRVGAAKMTIIEAVPSSDVSVLVDWRKPFKAHNLNEFTIHAHGDVTEVIWRIQASNLYVMKVVGIFVDMQSEFGKHMELGLKRLKSAAEKHVSESGVGRMPD